MGRTAMRAKMRKGEMTDGEREQMGGEEFQFRKERKCVEKGNCIQSKSTVEL
jgi:hypothetical protein